MDILNFLEESEQQVKPFESHLAVDWPIEQKLLYLQALALIMSADGDIDEQEIEYLRLLLVPMALDKSLIDELLLFAKKPDADTVNAFFSLFRATLNAQLFLFDGWMIAQRDGEANEKEKAVIAKMAERLDIADVMQRDIKNVFDYIQNQRWEEVAVYVKNGLFNPTIFVHLLSFFGADTKTINTLSGENEENEKVFALSAFADKTITWGRLSYGYDFDIEESEISTEPVYPELSYQLVCQFLETMVEKEALSFDIASNAFCDNGRVVFELNKHPLKYDRYNNAIEMNAGSEDLIVKNINTELLITMLELEQGRSYTPMQLFTQLCEKMYQARPALAKTKSHYENPHIYFPRCDNTPVERLLYKKTGNYGVYLEDYGFVVGVTRSRRVYDKSFGANNYTCLDSEKTQWVENDKFEDGTMKPKSGSSSFLDNKLSLGEHVVCTFRWQEEEPSFTELLAIGTYLYR